MVTFLCFLWVLNIYLQEDVEVWFNIGEEYEKAEELDPTSWTEPKQLCTKKGATVRGEIGPFGLLVLAAEGLKEYTTVYFKIFKVRSKHVLLMCSDQSRSSFCRNCLLINDSHFFILYMYPPTLTHHFKLKSI